MCLQDVFDMFLWSGCVCLALMVGRRLDFYLQHTKWPLCETGSIQFCDIVISRAGLTFLFLW